MAKADFEKQVIQLLGQVIEKQNEHDENFKMINERFNTIESKLSEHDKRFDTITEQTAVNTELAYTIKETKELAEKSSFEIELIKKFLRS